MIPNDRKAAIFAMMKTNLCKKSRSHEWIDKRSLAMDLAVAAKLEADPSLLVRAKETVQRWISC